MENLHEIYDWQLHDMEALYTWGFEDACADISPETKRKAKELFDSSPAPEPTPLKFLSPESKQLLIEKTVETVHASKIWILPFEYNEWDESRNVLVICTIDPKTGNEDIDNNWLLWKALHDLLRGKKAGYIRPYITWDAVLESYIPNPALPKYLPDWEKQSA